MEVGSLKDYLVRNTQVLIQSILRGKYRPNQVRRICIPKENGSKRQLGVPTVLNRVIQQSICHILSPVYGPRFSYYGYGFRPKRNAYDALNKCREYITDGYRFAVDMDLGKLFDTESHRKLTQVLSRSNGLGYERRKEALRQYIRGWVHYFKLADMENLLLRIDMWCRRRLCMVTWKQTKRLRTKGANLTKPGMKSKAWEWANTRKGY